MKTIIWDVDDVLNDLMHDWFLKHWCYHHPECKLTYEGILENPPHNILKISLDEYKKSLDEFRLNFGNKLKPVPEVLSWFQLYGNQFRHIALTSVPLSLAHISAQWTIKYFGVWIRSFNVVPSPRETDTFFEYDRTKKEYLNWLCKGDIIVDDNLLNIEGGKELNMITVLMPRPWNNSKLSIYESLQLLRK